MVLFPDARRALENAPADEPPLWSDEYDVVAVRARDRALAAAEPREDVAAVLDLDADGVPCRLYRPFEARKLAPQEPPGAAPEAGGVIVHLHGGGFVLNDVEVHDAACRRFANRARVPVLSVDFRRPPEDPFPAAPDDVDTVLRWLEGRPELPGPTYAHGDSAGGNLALVAALRNPGRFRAVALLYPFLDPTMSSDSYRTAADGFDPRDAEWYWRQYAGRPEHLEHPDLAPLRSDRLGTLPPTLVVTAEHDPLRDEGEELARRLAAEGVEVVATRYLGQIHGFWRHPEFVAAEPLMRQVAGFLAQH